jgi:hypothetical protein
MLLMLMLILVTSFYPFSSRLSLLFSYSAHVHRHVTDVVIAPEAEYGSTAKPLEMYEIIERFALGRRRSELFGEVSYSCHY